MPRKERTDGRKEARTGGSKEKEKKVNNGHGRSRQEEES